MTNIDPATLTQIETALGQDGVWVSSQPAVTKTFTPAVEQKIVAAVKDSQTPIYVVLVDVDHDDPLFHGDVSALFATIRDDTGRQGVYIGLEYDGTSLHTTEYGYDNADSYVSTVARAKHPDDRAQQVLTAISLVKSGKAQSEYEKMPTSKLYPKTASGTGSNPSDSSGPSGALIGIGIGAAIAVLAVVLAFRRRRRPALVTSAGGRTAVTTGRPFTLPAAVLSTVRAAEDKRNADHAESDVLALGEEIDAADMSANPTAAAAQAWQSTLDHYDLARRILDREHSPADVIGVIVLAGRGRAALHAALRGTGWKPVKPCYLNPLHGPGTREVRWEGHDGSVTVPACSACAKAIRAGREPNDILDFVVDGTTRHYFELKLEPWSSTGYGALDTDLLTRLFSR